MTRYNRQPAAVLTAGTQQETTRHKIPSLGSLGYLGVGEVTDAPQPALLNALHPATAHGHRTSWSRIPVNRRCGPCTTCRTAQTAVSLLTGEPCGRTKYRAFRIAGSPVFLILSISRYQYPCAVHHPAGRRDVVSQNPPEMPPPYPCDASVEEPERLRRHRMGFGVSSTD